jgi:hypothetical protein
MKTSASNSFSFWVLPGLIAGVVFLVIAFVSGALSTTFWAMPDAIAQTVGVTAPANYSFAPVPVLVGVVVHLALSVGLGALFALLVRWWRLRGWMIILAAVIFVSVETATALWVVLFKVESAATFHFFLAAVPLWGSVLGHYVYALILGLFLLFHPSTSARKAQQSIALDSK